MEHPRTGGTGARSPTATPPWHSPLIAIRETPKPPPLHSRRSRTTGAEATSHTYSVRRGSNAAACGALPGSGSGSDRAHVYSGAAGSNPSTGSHEYVSPNRSVHIHPAGGRPSSPSVPSAPSIPSRPATPGAPDGPGTVESAPGAPLGPGTVESAPGTPDAPDAPGLGEIVGPGLPDAPASPISPFSPGSPVTDTPGSPGDPDGPATGVPPRPWTCRASASMTA